jgi:hypothetical protein
VFESSYVSSAEYCGFRYNEFGNKGDSPQCNSLERFHLSSKGTREYGGYYDFGHSLNEMLNHQFPRLGFQVSCRIENFQKLYRIDDRNACDLDSELLFLAGEIYGTVDAVLGPDHWGVCYYNNRAFTGTPITKERIDQFRMALKGDFPLEDPLKRGELFDAAGDGICVVKRKVGVDDENHVMCDCTRYWKRTVCQHAYHFKYGDPNLSKMGSAKMMGPKRVLKFNQRIPYVRGKKSYAAPGFIKQNK